jgi:hypothetical protein
MDAKQRESLRHDGYIIVKNAISQELVAELNFEVDLRLTCALPLPAACPTP